MTTTHVEQSNVELVRRGFAAFEAADMATLSGLFAADATWYSSPLGVLSGSYNGRDAILESFVQLQKEAGGTFRSKPMAMAAAGDKVFVQTQATGERKGRKLKEDDVLVFTIAGGVIREVHLYHEDHPAAADFWS